MKTENVTRLYPLPPVDIPVEELYLDLKLPAHSVRDESLPYLAINMVTSIDGRVAIEGRANDIGGAADRRVMRNLRSLFDAVLRGAGTLRAEKISAGVPDALSKLRVSRGLPEQPYEVILTRSGRVPLGDNLLGANPASTIVMVPESWPSHAAPHEGSHATLVRAPSGPDGDVCLPDALRLLKNAYGMERILVEGGPGLNHALVHASLIEDLFLTLAPRLLGGSPQGSPSLLSGHTLPQSPGRKVQLLSAHLAADELFLRYGNLSATSRIA